MSKGIIIIFIFGIILFGGVIALYFYFQKPLVVESNENISSQSVHIRALGKDSGEQIITDYIITLRPNDQELFSSGTTTIKDYVKDEVPLNTTFFVINTNREGQYYYLSRVIPFSLSNENNIRVDMELMGLGEVKVNHTGSIIDKRINITISNDAYFRWVSMCFRWSGNIIGVESINLTQITIPERLNLKVDKCFTTREHLHNSSITIPLEIRTLGSVVFSDIEVFVLDGDKRYDTVGNFGEEYIFEEDGLDIATPDYFYIINNNL